MFAIARIVRLSSLGVLASLCLGQTRPAVPVRIPLAPATQPAEATPGVEIPALYDLARQVVALPPPGPGQGVPYDRAVLLGQPEAFLGDLITLAGRHVETTQVRLAGAPEDAPGMAWSVLAIDSGREPVQILTLGHRPEFGRLERIRCVGYFYKVRLDLAEAPDRRTGKVATVQVPVLVGWVLPEASAPARPSLPAAPWQILGATVAAAFVLFFAMMVFARRRVDWRTRAAERRGRRDWTDKTGQDG